MTLDAKTVALYLPIAAAVAWGFAYASSQVIMTRIPYSAYVVADVGARVLLVIAMIGFMPGPLDFSGLKDKNTLLLTLACVLCSCFGYLAMVYSIRHVSAVYAGAIEIMYPAFIALFSVYLFRLGPIHWTTLLGGGLILAGSVIVVAGKSLQLAGKG